MLLMFGTGLGVSNGMRANKLKCNPDKTVSGKADQGLQLSPALNGVILP